MKKVGVLILTCIMLVMVAACGSDATGGGNTDLTELINRIEALEDENKALKNQMEEFEDRITISYDWDNPIIVTSDELYIARSAGYDNYLNLFYNKVVQVTGRATGVGGSTITVISTGKTNGIYCRFSSNPSVSDSQTITVKGVVGGGFDHTIAAGLADLYYCRIV